MLQASQLVRKVGEKVLLDRASVQLLAGDRVALVGPSGSGKTVLLRSLAMLDPIDSGSMQWRGADIPDAKVSEFRSRVMYLHQQPVGREGTVESALREPFELTAHRDKRFSRRQIVQWLKQIGKPESFLNQSHLDLSGGESQIVALLRAMQLDPNILLLDEPTSALDADTGSNVESLLLDWAAVGDRALVWITHDAAQASRISNRTIRIAGGRLEVH